MVEFKTRTGHKVKHHFRASKNYSAGYYENLMRDFVYLSVTNLQVQFKDSTDRVSEFKFGAFNGESWGRCSIRIKWSDSTSENTVKSFDSYAAMRNWLQGYVDACSGLIVP